MKILMLGWELPPYNTGGLGVACYHLCKALSGDGVDIEFVVPYAEPHDAIDFMRITSALPHTAARLQQAGGAYTSGPSELSALRAQQAAYTEAVCERARQPGYDYDAIHAHDWLTFEAGMAAKQLSHKPLVAHVHATEFDRAGERYGNPLVHDIEYTALCMADRIIAVSQATKATIVREYHIPAEKIEVVHNSIDTDQLQPLDVENCYRYLTAMKQLGYMVVTNVGRLTVQKGLTHLLHAARQALAKQPKLLFLLAGVGEQYHELLELSAELGISESIIFTGEFARGKAWRDAFAIGDVFVLPSVSEPFGITVLEAIGYGSPAIVSRQAGVREVIRNVLTFDCWDTQKLADQLVALADHRSLRETLAANAQAELRGLSWSQAAEQCRRLYETVLERHEVLA